MTRLGIFVPGEFSIISLGTKIPGQVTRATFGSHAQAFGGVPKALSNAPVVLKKWVPGPSGLRIKVTAVREIVVSILYGKVCL